MTVAERLAIVRTRILDAGGTDDVAVVGVTKRLDVSVFDECRAAGLTAIGENYAQELIAKRDHLHGLSVHFIGQLQTNKVRHLAGIVDVYETVDRHSLIDELAKRSAGATVFVQVDTSDEPGKGGCPLADVDDLVRRAQDAGLDVDGLMTVGPTAGGAEAARVGFAAVRAAVDRLGLTVCSMGMTHDLEVAVQEGSTQVRVGTALFGPRP